MSVVNSKAWLDGRLSESHCECGAVRIKGSPGCARCTFLDGTMSNNSGVFFLIQELRATGPMTTEELANALGRARESVNRSLLTLEKRGRVRAFREADAEHLTWTLIDGARRRA